MLAGLTRIEELVINEVVVEVVVVRGISPLHHDTMAKNQGGYLGLGINNSAAQSLTRELLVTIVGELGTLRRIALLVELALTQL
jgi:hypothetical protein